MYRVFQKSETLCLICDTFRKLYTDLTILTILANRT